MEYSAEPAGNPIVDWLTMHYSQTDSTAKCAPAESPDDEDPVSPATARAPVYVGSEVFRRAAFGSHHPLNIVRHAAVFDLVSALDWLEEGDFRQATLTEFHDPAYVAALQAADAAGRVEPEVRERYCIGTLENPLFGGLFERAATTVGGSILAANLACDGHTAFHPSGGTHHGRPDRASGFCYFNDPVFAIRTFLARGRQRVMYIDLDAHHGDGVQAAFADEGRVMTVSIHEQDRWPYSGELDDRGNGSARNLPVPRALNDSELDYLIEHAVLPLAVAHEPEALVICCGADCLAGDPLSGMMLSNGALFSAVERLLALGQPTVVLGGGGYNPWTVARYWAGLWGRLCGHPFPATLPPEAAEVFCDMECDLVDEDDMDPEWLTTLEDSPNFGPVRPEIVCLAQAVIA
jgi:acetoin utilization protein AcuC